MKLLQTTLAQMSKSSRPAASRWVLYAASARRLLTATDARTAPPTRFMTTDAPRRTWSSVDDSDQRELTACGSTLRGSVIAEITMATAGSATPHSREDFLCGVGYLVNNEPGLALALFEEAFERQNDPMSVLGYLGTAATLHRYGRLSPAQDTASKKDMPRHFLSLAYQRQPSLEAVLPYEQSEGEAVLLDWLYQCLTHEPDALEDYIKQAQAMQREKRDPIRSGTSMPNDTTQSQAKVELPSCAHLTTPSM